MAGVPTRLLDWSRVGLNAAYFGAVEAARCAKESGELSVWALSVAFVEQIQAIEEQHPNLLENAPHIRIITAPRSSNANLHAQAGLFTLWWHMAKIAPLSDVCLQIISALERSDWPWKETPLHRFELPWSEAPKLLRMLAWEQVDAVRMFPGLDGVVRGMKERSLWDRKD